MQRIERMTAAQVNGSSWDLVEMLQEAVAEGAGLGFFPPLAASEAEAFWQQVAVDVADGSRIVLAARGEAGRVVGTASLDLCMRPNGLHRAECQKVIVRRDARRRGVGRALMLALEREARAAGRTTLFLDTFADQDARRLYESSGWIHSGDIPAFARMADGTLGATSLYYKLL